MVLPVAESGNEGLGTSPFPASRIGNQARGGCGLGISGFLHSAVGRGLSGVHCCTEAPLPVRLQVPLAPLSRVASFSWGASKYGRPVDFCG